MRRMLALTLAAAAVLSAGQADDPYNYPIAAPRLESAATIDGNLSEWRDHAFSDGVWDIARIAKSPWYDPARNRLTVHGDEPSADDDLAARYFIAWDDEYLYLGAEVRDNVNDVADPAHEPRRWYYKDSICWFIEAPRGNVAKNFGEGDNAFCFVIDKQRPPYAAWWRHGAPDKTYVEEPIPAEAVDYSIKMSGHQADFTLEARVAMKATLGASSPNWRAPAVGDFYGLEIVHTDPDGGDYGGHFIIYGTGDDDSPWGSMKLAPPSGPIERQSN